MQPYTPPPSPEYPMPVSVSAVRHIFRDAADLVVRPLTAGGHAVTAFFLDGVTSGSEIAEFILQPLLLLPELTERGLYEACLQRLVWSAVADPCPDMDTVCLKLINGFCVLILPQGKAVACEAKTGEKRSPSAPEVENTVKGAKDAFTETNRTNTSLVRRHLRCPELQVWETVVGRRSHTNVSVLSVRGLTSPELVQSVRQRIEEMDLDGLLSPAAVEEYLTGSRKTAFPMLQFTERTDRFCQGLLAGQVGVFVDGLPLGYLLPVNIGRLMTAAEDRGADYITASCIRLLRYIALLTALLLPALYVAMAQFHPAMIPTQLLRAIIQSKENVPFPTIAEVVGLLVAFELLQEAGLHLPQTIGHTVSIIGGLVVGTAAVEASLISPAALIVVSVAGICGFAVPGKDLSDAVRVWRFVLTLCAAVSGLFGLTLGCICLLVHMGSLSSCGRPYLAPFSDLRTGGLLLRRRLVTNKFRPPEFSPRDKRNQR